MKIPFLNSVTNECPHCFNSLINIKAKKQKAKGHRITFWIFTILSILSITAFLTLAIFMIIKSFPESYIPTFCIYLFNSLACSTIAILLKMRLNKLENIEHNRVLCEKCNKIWLID